MTASAIRSATGCATPLTRLRRALPPVLLPILALGTFASIDALQTQMRLPEHALFMSTGDTVELTGVIRAPLPSAPPAWRLTISPDSVPVTLRRHDQSKNALRRHRLACQTDSWRGTCTPCLQGRHQFS